MFRVLAPRDVTSALGAHSKGIGTEHKGKKVELYTATPSPTLRCTYERKRKFEREGIFPNHRRSSLKRR